MALNKAVEQLQEEVKIKTKEIAQINRAIKLLQGGTSVLDVYIKSVASRRKGRKLSAETIAKIRESQKKRWAALKKKTPKKV